MPTVAVDKADLWERLGQEFTTDEFDKLCFDYGLELDEDTTEEVEENIKKGLPTERPQLKIEIPANRYDLLCIEGIARALLVFLQKQDAPKYKLVYPKGGESDLLTVKIDPSTAAIRPLFACAILRNIKFTEKSYASFIDLQDKLHQNICRRRQLVAIGTHDLDTLTPPFRYEAKAPSTIKFAPLGKTQEYTAEELMTLYEGEKHLAKYLHIIRDSPVYPIIYDSKDQVLSMPPIINSDHSKITLNTRNVFIDVTATDQTKLDIVVNMAATMFSEYCEEPFTIEPVKIILPNGQSCITPDISARQMTAHASYVNSCTGLSLSSTEVATLLKRMSLEASVNPGNSDEITVSIPPTRPDIFHECDIMEDAAIAYGFNNLPDKFPATSTVGQPLAISKLSDVVRLEWALAGFIEVLPLILCSHEDNFEWLNHEDDNKTAVKIANPKTLEFQVVRTTLVPGLLKTIRENRSHALPIKIFESSDVVFKDTTRERQARNERHAAAVYCNKSAGFAIVHGMLDRAMKMLEIPRISSQDSSATTGYYIKETTDGMYFPGRASNIYYRSKAQPSGTISELKGKVESALHIHHDVQIGSLGILHPTPFKKQMQKVSTNED
ncbi:phenylalanyl-tRNA synthetase subunit beta [Ephemerocybe angulata]|uniref:Phenylalanine--tRNA ligase beta subunit n=1 Tax=Ephemerocybe angulata TaxID=980116 RepID=A0A8H6HFG4_9AGAR|nr:phenylalanyl-tRNA synthetase subunit beta [Tulosesus angulatus]